MGGWILLGFIIWIGGTACQAARESNGPEDKPKRLKGDSMKYTITFMATGGITIEANSEEEASNKFEDKLDEAFEELKQNGISITGIYCPGKEDTENGQEEN